MCTSAFRSSHRARHHLYICRMKPAVQVDPRFRDGIWLRRRWDSWTSSHFVLILPRKKFIMPVSSCSTPRAMTHGFRHCDVFAVKDVSLPRWRTWATQKYNDGSVWLSDIQDRKAVVASCRQYRARMWGHHRRCSVSSTQVPHRGHLLFSHPPFFHLAIMWAVPQKPRLWIWWPTTYRRSTSVVLLGPKTANQQDHMYERTASSCELEIVSYFWR